ncbi:MFS transporter [Brackiella oedipodis]|uniref:MFS transporter n=1 Tax=Brackiella oedipodis TaxID=124225 RepID=UPI000571FDD5|nr:nitrate/nitrite transporter [Brackiella oedipodis]
MLTAQKKANSVLFASTLSFTTCFMVWMIFSVAGMPIKDEFNLNPTQFGLLTAMPVLTGSLCRMPLGMLTDKYGGKIVMFLLMILCVPAVFLLKYANNYYHFLLISLWLGLVGGSFSVGTPYVAKWFDKKRQGMAMGIFGAGVSGTAVNLFIAPFIISAYGWRALPVVYAAILLVVAVIFWCCSFTNKAHLVTSQTSLWDQIKLIKDKNVLKYSQYYTVVFGGYVGISLWMVNYYVEEYHLNLTQAALIATCFSLPGGVLRAMGGWLSDKFGAHRVTWSIMWVCWVAFFLLSYPQTQMTIQTIHGPSEFYIGLNVYVFSAILFVVAIALAIGQASVFKYIANDFPENIGTVSGIVGLAGGIGGFLLPILFGALTDITGIRSSSFMLMYGTVCVSLIWMHFSFRKNN